MGTRSRASHRTARAGWLSPGVSPVLASRGRSAHGRPWLPQRLGSCKREGYQRLATSGSGRAWPIARSGCRIRLPIGQHPARDTSHGGPKMPCPRTFRHSTPHLGPRHYPHSRGFACPLDPALIHFANQRHIVGGCTLPAGGHRRRGRQRGHPGGVGVEQVAGKAFGALPCLGRARQGPPSPAH